MPPRSGKNSDPVGEVEVEAALASVPIPRALDLPLLSALFSWW
jgi:hypothetical protein